MTSMELAAWATLMVAFAGLIVAVLTVWWQLRRQWLLHSAGLITQLVDRFESPEWHGHRRVCAERLRLHHCGAQELDLSTPFPVLAFLENVAHLTRRGALDLLMVWNKFGWLAVAHYYAMSNRVNALAAVREKEGDQTMWEEFEWLAQECLRIYRRRGVAVDDPRRLELQISQLALWEGNLGKNLGEAPNSSAAPVVNRAVRGRRR